MEEKITKKELRAIQQRAENTTVATMADYVLNKVLPHGTLTEYKRLRHCEAYVYTYEYEHMVFHVLRSYNTYVCCIAGQCSYDFLRHVYGYTATSAQHIAKFIADYLPYSIKNRQMFRYYPV